jgi:hypothetical protein
VETKMKVMHFSAASMFGAAILVFILFFQNLSYGQHMYPEDVEIVWAEPAASGAAILYGRLENGVWSDPLPITGDQTFKTAPAMIRERNRTWIFWSSFDGSGSTLYYRVYEEGRGGEAHRLATEFSSNTTPAAVVDSEGKVRIFWAGYDGEDDEIISATWNGSFFEPPVRITDNGVPDILPVAGMDGATGQLFVQWQQYAGTGYKEVHVSWPKEQWSGGSVQPPVEPVEGDYAGIRDSVPEDIGDLLPAHISIPQSVSFHIHGAVIQSLPLRFAQEKQ